MQQQFHSHSPGASTQPGEAAGRTAAALQGGATRQATRQKFAQLIESLGKTQRELTLLLENEGEAGCGLSAPRAAELTPLAPHTLSATMLDALPGAAALLDAGGAVICGNSAWENGPGADAGWCRALGVRAAGRGESARARAAQDEGLRAIAAGVGSVLAGKASDFSGEYTCDIEGDPHTFVVRMKALAGPGAGEHGGVLTHLDVTERRRLGLQLAKVSIELERRERLLSTVLSSTTDLTCAADRNGRLVYANQQNLDLWGRGLHEVLGKTVHELGFPEETAASLDAQLRQVLSTGTRHSGEATWPRGDGTDGHYEYLLSPALGPDGSVEFVISVARDITARKLSERALDDSIAQFRALAAAMPQIVWVLDPEGACVYLNQRWTARTGRSLDEGLGSGWLDAVHPEDRERVTNSVHSMLRGEQDGAVEARVALRDGSHAWCLFSGVASRDAQGQVAKWFGTCTDIDRIKGVEAKLSKANQELDRQRRELRTVFDLVPALVWFKDTEQRVLHINQRAAEMAGCTVEDAVGREIGDLFPARSSAIREEDAEIARTGTRLLGKVDRFEDASGAVQWFQRDKVPCFDEQGRIVGTMVMMSDITDRKRDQDALSELNMQLEARVRDRTAELVQARDEAERANRAKSAFLAAMSHEIRTPMSGLLGLLELLELSALDGEQRSTLRVARTSGKALNQIIDGLLDFAKIEANSVELNPAPASLVAVIDNVSRLHAPVAANKGLDLWVSVDPRINALHRFDELRFGQVLNNLLSNAVKFTEAGEVSLQVALEQSTGAQESLRVTVRDTGIGIPPACMNRLFRPFAQAEAQTFRQYGGTGLGLFIARHLVELMGGTLTVESEPGRGTSFCIRLHFETCADGARPELVSDADSQRLNQLVAARRAPTVEEAEATGTLLLVVDDHPVNRMLLLRQLSALGYAAEAAADGLHALKAWESGRFGAIITDYSMPRMDGCELARQIRAAEAASGTGPVLIVGCTANASASARQACLEAGMSDCITKPVGLQELSELLDWYLPLPAQSPGAAAVRGDAVPQPDAGKETLLDMAAVAGLSQREAGGAAGVLTEFRAANEEDAARLRAAVAARDFAQAAQLAHRMRGACAMLGAATLAEACAEVERAAAAADIARLATAMELLAAEDARLAQHLAVVSAGLTQGRSLFMAPPP